MLEGNYELLKYCQASIKSIKSINNKSINKKSINNKSINFLSKQGKQNMSSFLLFDKFCLVVRRPSTNHIA